MRRLAILALALTALAAAWQFADHFAPLPAPPDISRVVTDRDGLPLRVFPVDDGRWRMAAAVEDVDPRFIEALLLIEDQRFFEHRGVDGLAVMRAARDNIMGGRVVSGASTISMQTARLLEPRPRNLGAKVLQLLRARQLERRMTKAEILELYLTLAPYGGNLEGIRAASLGYFGKEPRALTDAEIALLIALPQSPEARRPDRRPEGALAARNAILTRLAAEGFKGVGLLVEAQAESIPTQRQSFPAAAWHFAEGVGGPTDPRGEVRSTIDRPAQHALERLLRAAAEDEGPRVQAAGLIVDLQSRAIIASVGSIDRRRPGGWLDLTRRQRSPGSTLKPFVYGLAMQEGIVSPGSRIADLPARFGAYEPRNFGRDFNGELTLAEALQHSLNVPAVMLLDQLGPERFAGTLRNSGLGIRIPHAEETSEGLATALGGLGLTARDLAVLYAALADGGMAKPLRSRVDDAEGPAVRVLSEDAAANIVGILTRAPSVSGRMPAHLAQGAPRVAFKTGTSYGFRDAWAAGVSGRHAVIVWTGRADGAARPGKTGRDAALPTLFAIFDAIEAATPGRLATIPEAEPSRRTVRLDDGPLLLFPIEEAALWQRAPDRPFLFAARGRGPLRWYVGDEQLFPDTEGNMAWLPPGPGFYRVTVIDGDGQRDSASFRVVQGAS